MTAYYNEHDKQAAAWLRELIRAGAIAPGDVDERSIEDVKPADLRGYTQVHLFAGIGTWSYALRQAGVPDSRRVWTISCPCQPFSAAGAGAGFADERHLWPAALHLIRVLRPELLVGEQVASGAADAWVDLVQDDLEALGYPFGAVPFASALVGAPHIRDRLYWMGHALGTRLEGLGRDVAGADPHGSAALRAARSAAQAGFADWLANHDGVRQQSLASAGLRADAEHDAEPCGGAGRLADADGAESEQPARPGPGSDDPQGTGPDGEPDGRSELAGAGQPGPVNGYWADADWLFCRDGKWRAVEPGTQPLVDGAAARVVRLRGYGNGINAIAAKIWIESCVEAIDEMKEPT